MHQVKMGGNRKETQKKILTQCCKLKIRTTRKRKGKIQMKLMVQDYQQRTSLKIVKKSRKGETNTKVQLR